MSIIELLVLLIAVEIAVGIFSTCVMIYINNKTNARIKQYEININANIDDSIPAILESFVNSNFIDYRLKNIDPMGLVNITQEHEKKIIDDMIEICGSRMSNAMLDKLSLFWSLDAISSVIADKIYLTVVSFCSQFNATKQNVDQIGSPIVPNFNDKK